MEEKKLNFTNINNQKVKVGASDCGHIENLIKCWCLIMKFEKMKCVYNVELNT